MQLELKNWLKLQDKLWLAGYIATLLLPFGLIFNRGLMESCAISICILFLVNSFRNKQWEWLHNPAIKIGLAIWIWLLFISLFAQNIADSFGVAIPWIRYLLLYAALQNWLLVKSENIYFLGKTLVFMLCFIIIDTLWQYIFGISLTGNSRDSSGRLSGPMDNVKIGIFITKMLFPAVGICLLFSSIKKNYTGVIFSLILLVIAIATILVSGERTAFFSTIIAIIIMSFCLIIYEPKLKIYILIGIATIILLAEILFATQYWVQERAIKFYETISTYPTTEYGQLGYGGLIIGMNNIITGAGLKGFRTSCPELLANNQVTACNLHPHNLYIEWFAETGVVGLLLFISLACYWISTVTKSFIEQKGVEKLLPAFALSCLIINFFPFMPTQSIFSNWPTILLFYSVSVAMTGINAIKSRVN